MDEGVVQSRIVHLLCLGHRDGCAACMASRAVYPYLLAVASYPLLPPSYHSHAGQNVQVTLSGARNVREERGSCKMSFFTRLPWAGRGLGSLNLDHVYVYN